MHGLQATWETLRLLAGAGGTRQIKLWIYRLRTINGRDGWAEGFIALRLQLLWAAGRQEELMALATRHADGSHSSSSYYFLALHHHVRGNWEDSIFLLRQLLTWNPGHSDGILLLARSLAESGRKDEAWDVLEAHAEKSRRSRTWSELARLVTDATSYARMARVYESALCAGRFTANRADLAGHLATAAAAVGDYPAARKIWLNLIRTHGRKRKPFLSRLIRVPSYTVAQGTRALLDLNRVLTQSGIPVFLISGTLLGMVRDGALLKHDKDIDAGIWDDVPVGRLEEVIRKSGLFEFIPTGSPLFQRLRHGNGIILDLFIHVRSSRGISHESARLRWWNSPFEIVEKTFPCGTFFIPTNETRYLAENYGPDWQTPQADFDSLLDTPNAEIINSEDYTIQLLKRIWFLKTSGDMRRLPRVLEKFREVDEVDATVLHASIEN